MAITQRLNQLGYLRSGYHYRSVQELQSGDPYQGVQINAITEDGLLDWTNLEPIQFTGFPKQYRIQAEDVLFALRGSRTLATVAINPPDDVLAVGHWAILTPDVTQVDSGYLVWYWNHPAVSKRREKMMSKGTNIQFISMQDCRNFEVQLPSLQQQRQIARVAELRQQERQLVRRIEDLRDTLVYAATMQAAIQK